MKTINRTKSRRHWQNIPWGLIACLFVLTAMSLLFIQSASFNSSLNKTLPYAKKQVMRLVFSAIIMIGVVFISPRKIGKNAWIIYGGGILGLIAVFIVGQNVKGATRWIPVGPIRLQPSEIMKICLIITLARYLSRADVDTFPRLAIPFAIVGLPLLMILKQPDLGTSLTLIPLLFALLYIRGAKTWHLALVISVGIALVPMAWYNVLKDYQKNRVYAFLEPERFEKGIGYQAVQSRIAVGSGGFWGKGVFKGSQTQLNFLPERHTDFIFAVIAEEWGFIGAAFVLGMLFLLVAIILEIAFKTQDEYGRLLCVGVAVLITVQIFINVGMTVGLMPITGLTLPYISYGGSSTLMFWIAMGLVIGVAVRR